MNLYKKALNLDIDKIITDSDLDGVVTAAILRKDGGRMRKLFLVTRVIYVRE